MSIDVTGKSKRAVLRSSVPENRRFSVRRVRWINQYGSNSITKQVVVSPSGGGSPTITVSPSSINSGTANQAYNQTTAFSASGGTAPYSYAHISGSLPSGMSFNPSTRKFEGTTAQTGTFSNLVIRAADANGYTGQRSYTLVINATGGGTGDIIIYVFEDGAACCDEAGVIYRVWDGKVIKARACLVSTIRSGWKITEPGNYSWFSVFLELSPQFHLRLVLILFLPARWKHLFYVPLKQRLQSVVGVVAF